MKNSLNEIKSLMSRMEELPNGKSGFLVESYLNEVSCKWRDVVGEEEFFDLLSGLKQGSRVTFGYVTAAKIEVPKGKKLNPATNRMNQFDDYATLGKNLGEEGTLIGVIKLTIYNLPWQTNDNVEKEYNDWKTVRNQLGDKYGVEFGKARYGTQTNNFDDKGGIISYNGQNQDLSTHTYTNLNLSGVKPISTAYYLVMEDGTIKEIDVAKLTLLPAPKSESAIQKLRAAGATEQEVEPLLNMQYQRFEHSRVLFVSATPDNGIPTLLINNKLSNKIGAIEGVPTENIINLAKERYKRFVNNDVNFVQ